MVLVQKSPTDLRGGPVFHCVVLLQPARQTRRKNNVFSRFPFQKVWRCKQGAVWLQLQMGQDSSTSPRQRRAEPGGRPRSCCHRLLRSQRLFPGRWSVTNGTGGATGRVWIDELDSLPVIQIKTRSSTCLWRSMWETWRRSAGFLL